MADKERRELTLVRQTSIPVVATTEGDRIAEERIRRRAYGIYQKRERDGVAGDAVSDWLCAQSELKV